MIKTLRLFCSNYRWTSAYVAVLITLLFVIKVLEIFQVLP